MEIEPNIRTGKVNPQKKIEFLIHIHVLTTPCEFQFLEAISNTFVMLVLEQSINENPI